MRHMHGERGMAVEQAGIDEPDRGHDQGEFPPHRAGCVVTIELLGLIELERWVDEDEHVELADFLPEWVKRRIVDEFALELGGDHNALEAELMATAGKFFERCGTAERMGVRGADEAPPIIALGLRRPVID